MKAAVMHAPSTPLAIEELTLQEPREREVLVTVTAAGVCHSDYHYMQGHLPCPSPIVLGHEGAGIVEAVGPGVTRVAPGDQVVLMWRPRCGACKYCLAGRPALCEIGRLAREKGGLLDGSSRLRLGEDVVHHFLGVSCFAEQCVVAEESLLSVPSRIPQEIVAMAGCAVVTGIGVSLNVIGQAAGRSVLVIGAGGVGLSCVMGAQLVGADPIIVVDLAADKLALAGELGATHQLDATGIDVADAIQEICPGGVDWALEAVGQPATMEQAIASLAPGGTAVAIGLGQKGASFSAPINHLVQGDRGVRGSLYGSSNIPLDIPRILKLYESGRLPLDRLLGRTYPLSAVNEAYQDLAAGALGRGLIRPALA
jgi:Zn-dependent alcohol dehydrogenase